jgi:[ribosomal protein S5]-alanine N-acetyltransferase
MTATLQTERLLLRPFRRDDLDEMSVLMANQNFMRFSTGPYSREQSATFLEKIVGWSERGIPSLFAVIYQETGELLGYCGFYHPDGFDDVEIGYRLDSRYWNQGLATEAARAVRDHGFEDWNFSRLISLIHFDNVPSRRVAEKNGMVCERETVFKGFPTQVFAITRAQWQASRGV